DFSIVTSPLNGSLTGPTPINSTAVTVFYTPYIDFFGINTFMFRVNDTNTSFSNNATVTINVTAVNDPPVANDDSVTISEDSVVTLDVMVSVVTSVLANDTDVDGDTLTIIEIPIPAENGTAVINGTQTGITYTPFGNFTGPDSFDYKISDGNGGNATATVSVNVTQMNDAPVANNINYTTPEDIPVEIDLTGSDEEQSELEFTIVTPPENGTLGTITQSVDDASVLYTPNANFFGTDSFTFMVNDTAALAIDTAAVNITITAVNDPPIADDDIVTIEGNSAATLDILANDDDDDGDTLTIISTSSPSNGNVTIIGNGTSVMYTPDLNFIGVDSFDYSINDTNNVISAASVDIIVTEPEEFKVKKGTFAKSTAAAPIIQNITGVGFEPKALILFTTAQSTEGFSDSYSFAMGFSNGTSSRNVSVKSDDNGGVSNTGRAFGTNMLRIIGSGNPTIVARASVIGFNSDGFALNWTSNTITPSIIHYLALGGVDITDVAVSSFVANTTAINQTVSVGFQPDLVMFMHAGSTAEAGKSRHGYMSYGFATSPTERAAIAVSSEDNRNLMDTKKWQRTDRAIIMLTPSSGAIEAQADLFSMNPDGFTVEWIDPPADPDRVYYLAIKGGSYGVGSLAV
ncbi:MAG: Ig-like domain-containing protein, partial [Nitrososphaerales archaeon]